MLINKKIRYKCYNYNYQSQKCEINAKEIKQGSNKLIYIRDFDLDLSSDPGFQEAVI